MAQENTASAQRFCEAIEMLISDLQGFLERGECNDDAFNAALDDANAYRTAHGAYLRTTTTKVTVDPRPIIEGDATLCVGVFFSALSDRGA